MRIVEKILLLACIIGTISILITAIKLPVFKETTGGYAQGQAYYLSPGSGTAQGDGLETATTTRIYMETSDTASSTVTGVLERGDAVDLNLRAVASSSAAQLVFTPYVSQNAIDWYPVDAPTTTTSSRLQHNVGLSEHTWPLATSTNPICYTNEVCTHIQLTGFFGKYFKINFGIKGANASVHGYAIPRELVPN